MDNSDSRLTVGMPCALEEMISVYEYFERGGAWGIVRTQSVGKHNIWDSLPKILWTKVGPHSLSFSPRT